MLTLPSPNPSYQVGGSLPFNASTYVRRQADEVLFQGLLRGEFCYVFNSRQMGKSSLRVQSTHRLQAEGVRCGVIDITAIGTREVTPEQWYASILGLLVKTFKLDVNLLSWWRDRTHLSFVNRLSDFFDSVLLTQISAPIVIFIDEIDSVLSLKFSTDDFFALIRACYNRRAEQPEYHRLTFALFGVATPGDLISDATRTPFNVGQAIELRGFQLTEATPLMAGLTWVIPDADFTLQRILYWTGGQPFLTQKLCQMLVHRCAELKPTTKDFIDSFVQTHILRNWESQDQPEHLKTIRDRLLYSEQRVGRLLGIYQQILQGVEIPALECREQRELLLSGLVFKQAGLLQVKNRIYQEVFNAEWVEKQLSALRPYSQAFDAWTNSQKTDESRLLRGQALKDAQLWSQGKSLSDIDYQFLAASQECDGAERPLEAIAKKSNLL
ncbi:AAA-like domain-containing protein [Cylindrospermum stagnale]|uniref:AAA-like domain-containing protein n=1 Tax=Cylindrospermum stagnale TaxID=142864 RepID=UPI0002FC8B18